MKRTLPLAVETVKLTFPCLISVEKDIYIPRLPSYLKKQATKDKEITSFTLGDFDDTDPMHYGLNGSPTQVQRIFPPEVNDKREMWQGESGEIVSKFAGKLKELKFI